MSHRHWVWICLNSTQQCFLLAVPTLVSHGGMPHQPLWQTSESPNAISGHSLSFSLHTVNLKVTSNFATLPKEIKEDLDKWKDILHSWIGRFTILKRKYSPKPIIFAEMENQILKLTWNCKCWSYRSLLRKYWSKFSWLCISEWSLKYDLNDEHYQIQINWT